MKLVLKASLIPDCTEVTKPTGSKVYTLRNELPLYAVSGRIDTKVTSDEDVRFLASESGINIITADTELAIHFANYSALYDFTQREYMVRNAK